MPLLRFLFGVLTAVFFWALSLKIHSGAAKVFDPFLIVVLYHSLRSPPLGSAGAGTVVGLVHDALTGGLYGLHGFANTLTGYLAGLVRQHFVIQQPTQVALFCLLGGAAQVVILGMLQFMLVRGSDLPNATDAAIKTGLTGGLGMVVYVLAGRFFSWDRGRRERRRNRLGLDTDDV
ncbi:MAG: rod shape-determining protein MreD [Acidobacteriota bacterium]